MKMTTKPILITSILLATLVTAPLVFSGGKHAEGMEGGQMMNMDAMQDQMRDMTQMMHDAHNTKDMNKRHEMMQQHMEKMHNMMGNMESMMGDKMPNNMNMEQRQGMINKRMDMMQGMMKQILKQQSMIMKDMKK